MEGAAGCGEGGGVIQGGESMRVVHPLFQTEGSGSSPTSPLQLFFGWMPVYIAIRLNEEWHSRLPVFKYPPEKCLAIGGEYKEIYYAVSILSPPSARMLNNRGMYELRRLAIAPDAPRNTASRMLRIIAKLVTERRPDVKTLISYQDTEAHTGGIYKAAGWVASNKGGAVKKGWNTRSKNHMQSVAPKIRWEYDLKAAA